MQFQATLRTPSSNHLIEMLPGAKEVFSTLVKGLIQPMRLACSAQNPLGSLTERAYISLVLGLIDQGALGPFRGYIVNLLGHVTLHPAASERDTASRLRCCNDYASRADGADKRND